MKKQSKKRYIYIFVIVIILILIDQISKILVLNNIINISHVENTGLAFGINSKNNVYNIIASLIVIILLIRFMIKQKDINDLPTNISLSLIISGGISNLIDRVFRGKVIDFIDISSLFKFPTFNFADIFIVVGWVMFAFLIAKYTTTIRFRKSNYVDDEGE